MDKKTYKAMKQVIHNDLQVNRGVVDDIIKEYLENRITHIVKNYLDTHYNQQTLEKVVKAEIVKAVLASIATKEKDE